MIKNYTCGYTLETFLDDRKTQDAVVRNLEVIGQALKDYGIDELTEKKPDIPWQQIAGMRNILAHDYLGVDMVMIWDTVQLPGVGTDKKRAVSVHHRFFADAD